MLRGGIEVVVAIIAQLAMKLYDSMCRVASVAMLCLGCVCPIKALEPNAMVNHNDVCLQYKFPSTMHEQIDTPHGTIQHTASMGTQCVKQTIVPIGEQFGHGQTVVSSRRSWSTFV